MTADATGRSAAGAPGPTADQQRAAGLRRMKLLATSLFVLAALVYLLTRGTGGGWGFVNSFAEAAMVGALADWFAVTALFRHPMGLPVPHTAIIPTRKDALARNLEDFVADNFLSEEVVKDKIIRAGLTLRVARWLAEPPHARRVVAEVSQAVHGALRVVRDEDVAAVLEPLVISRLRQHGWSPPAGRVLAQVVQDGAHHRLVDLAVDEAARWLKDNEELVWNLVLERAPLWTPQFVDQRIARRVYAEASSFLADVRADPRHRVRVALDELLAQFAQDLQQDAGTMARAERWKENLLDHPGVREAVTSLWSTLRRILVEAVEDPDSELRQRAQDGVLALARQLTQDEALRARLDGYVAEAAGYVVRGWAPEVVSVISDTIKRWDASEASRRIELHVGRDLQFIRINGTVVGGLAGLAIHTITVLLP